MEYRPDKPDRPPVSLIVSNLVAYAMFAVMIFLWMLFALTIWIVFVPFISMSHLQWLIWVADWSSRQLTGEADTFRLVVSEPESSISFVQIVLNRFYHFLDSMPASGIQGVITFVVIANCFLGVIILRDWVVTNAPARLLYQNADQTGSIDEEKDKVPVLPATGVNQDFFQFVKPDQDVNIELVEEGIPHSENREVLLDRIDIEADLNRLLHEQNAAEQAIHNNEEHNGDDVHGIDVEDQAVIRQEDEVNGFEAILAVAELLCLFKPSITLLHNVGLVLVLVSGGFIVLGLPSYIAGRTFLMVFLRVLRSHVVVIFYRLQYMKYLRF